LLVLGAVYLFTGRAEAIDSIAVLPFKNLTGDTEQEYFVEGFTNELIWQLGRIGELRVISLTSVTRYKQTEKPLPEIARELNVDALVEGTVQQVGDSVSIGMRLIDALPEERNLWEQTYDRAMTDVFLLYSEVARAIAQEVRVKLTPQEETHFASLSPVNPEAYEAYLKGEFHWGLGTAEGHNKGLAFYHQAVEKDPTFAMAYAGLAFVYNTIGHSAMTTPDSFPRALAAARSALRLDETLVEAHAALAQIKLYHEWDWIGAQQ
jgi:TolB-like protein